LSKLFHVLNHFSLNEYDLQILSSVFLIAMFDLLGKELKCTQELKEAESLQKIRAQFYEVARHVWVELKL